MISWPTSLLRLPGSVGANAWRIPPAQALIAVALQKPKLFQFVERPDLRAHDELAETSLPKGVADAHACSTTRRLEGLRDGRIRMADGARPNRVQCGRAKSGTEFDPPKTKELPIPAWRSGAAPAVDRQYGDPQSSSAPAAPRRRPCSASVELTRRSASASPQISASAAPSTALGGGCVRHEGRDGQQRYASTVAVSRFERRCAAHAAACESPDAFRRNRAFFQSRAGHRQIGGCHGQLAHAVDTSEVRRRRP